MERAPFISICIPAYRRTAFLRRLLDSIAIQTYPHFEVVITDDSPDLAVQELADQHPVKPKIRYFKNTETLGTPENWNEGLRRANSDWIKIMHDDDWFSGPESLGYFADAVRGETSCFYFAAYTNTHSDGRSMPVQISERLLAALKQKPEILLAANRIGPPSTVMFKKDLTVMFDKRMRWLVDIDFYIRYLNQHPSAEYIPKNLIRIGISETQVTRSSFGNRQVEIPERFLLFEKIKPQTLKNLRVYDSWWRFVRNMRIRDLKDVTDHGYRGKIPESIQSMIRFQKHIPSPILNNGFFSKLLMGAHYLMDGREPR
jgi:glycosyltransferase involved in cell wall biosynthesis